MTRMVMLIFGLAMLVQLIRPVGLPGLRRRADAWKIAALALAITMAVAALKPNQDSRSGDEPKNTSVAYPKWDMRDPFA